jgi:hypothetical protein
MNKQDASSTLAGQVIFGVTASSSKHSQSDTSIAVRPEQLFERSDRTDADRSHWSTIDDTSRTQRIRRGKLFPTAPIMPIPREKFLTMQKWEGHVIEVGQDTFWARLVRTTGGGPDQEAEIYISEIDQEDRILIEPGAVFYWSIGYLDRPSGRIRASILRFRRLRPWSKHELEAAEIEAQRLKSLLSSE